MSLVNTKEILLDAHAECYAVGAFNISNMETAQAIIEGAIELNSPVIIEVSESAIKYMGMNVACGMVRALVKDISIPVALHLDHGRNWEVISRAIDSGFTSVMIDASDKPFAENVEITKKVVEKAHQMGVSVEAEIGRLPGSEDDVNVEEREAFLVNPNDAQKFVEMTGIDFLAPAIGTSHGAFKFKGDSTLDYDRLREVKEKTDIPLVLHGASSVRDTLIEEAERYGLQLKGAKGLDDNSLKQAIRDGINKVNTDTDIRIAFTTAVRRVLHNDSTVFDPRKLLGPAREYMKNVVKERIEILGSENRA
ncbi:MAG: class II fructose-1,6-bisphosphate aldolase [Candidatus Cloacimonadota bacterium]|nr:MAG: class II fructose-1,6-bisphosphate aldolase [Candidatus Cloacimonadota bacterium]